MAHHLGLEAIRQDVVDVVSNQISSNCVDSVFSFQNIAGGAVLLFDGQQFFFTAVAKQILECFIEGMLFVQRAIGRFAFVENLQRSAIIHRIHQPVGIDVLAEALVRLLLAMSLGDQWRAGKGNSRRVRECLEQVVAQIRALRSMGLINHQNDAFRGIHHPKGLAGWHGQVRTQGLGDRVGQRLLVLLKLVDHHHADVRAVRSEMLTKACAGVDHIHPPADQRGGVSQLLLKVLPVIDQHDLEIGQVTAGSQHPRQENHGERLA